MGWEGVYAVPQSYSIRVRGATNRSVTLQIAFINLFDLYNTREPMVITISLTRQVRIGWDLEVLGRLYISHRMPNLGT